MANNIIFIHYEEERFFYSYKNKEYNSQEDVLAQINSKPPTVEFQWNEVLLPAIKYLKLRKMRSNLEQTLNI